MNYCKIHLEDFLDFELMKHGDQAENVENLNQILNWIQRETDSEPMHKEDFKSMISDMSPKFKHWFVERLVLHLATIKSCDLEKKKNQMTQDCDDFLKQNKNIKGKNDISQLYINIRDA